MSNIHEQLLNEYGTHLGHSLFTVSATALSRTQNCSLVNKLLLLVSDIFFLKKHTEKLLTEQQQGANQISAPPGPTHGSTPGPYRPMVQSGALSTTVHKIYQAPVRSHSSLATCSYSALHLTQVVLVVYCLIHKHVGSSVFMVEVSKCWQYLKGPTGDRSCTVPDLCSMAAHGWS